MASEILIVRETDSFSRILIEQGFPVVNLPLIKTEPLADLSQFENQLENLDRFDGIFITSARAAEIFINGAKAKGTRFGGRFYVLGKRSADLLKAAGYAMLFGEKAKNAAQLSELIPAKDLKGKRFLFVRGSRSLRTIPKALENVAEVVETIVYQTVAVETNEAKLNEIKAKLARGRFIAVCFFSPSGVEEFLKKIENFSQSETKIAAVGQTTAQYVEEKNLRVDFVSTRPAAKDFAAELTEYLRKEI